MFSSRAVRGVSLALVASIAISVLTGCAPKTPQAQGEGMSNNFFLFNTIYFFALIWFGYYFLVIRPNVMKEKERKEFLEKLKKGEDVLTTGGIHGKFVSFEGDDAIIEVDRNVKLRIKSANLTVPAAPKKGGEGTAVTK